MKIKDMFTKEWYEEYGDIDVYDSDYDTEGIAFCGALLTPRGEEHFKGLLELEVEVGENFLGPCVWVQTGGDWNLCKAAEELFWDVAGYCDEDDWDAWFVELD